MFHALLPIFLLLISTVSDNWQTDMATAKTIAKEESKNILMVFSGSDWCAPCKKLKKNILLSEEFEAYANENLVVLYLDFPAKKKNKLSKEQTQHNEALADQYNSSGSFPNVLLVDVQGKVLKKLKYDGQSALDFITSIQ